MENILPFIESFVHFTRLYEMCTESCLRFEGGGGGMDRKYYGNLYEEVCSIVELSSDIDACLIGNRITSRH
jgi:hypothetical protein